MHELVFVAWQTIGYTCLKNNMTTIINYKFASCMYRCFGKKGRLCLVWSTSKLALCIALYVLTASVVCWQIGKKSSACTVGRKTWPCETPQNYTGCGDNLAKVNTICHFSAPDQLDCDWIKNGQDHRNTFRNYVAFLAGDHKRQSTHITTHWVKIWHSCYHEAFVTCDHYHDSFDRIIRSRFS